MPEQFKKGWPRVAFGDVVRLCRERSSNPTKDGFDRYVGLEHLEPGDLKIRRWGNIADGTTFTSVFHAGQVLFGKRRAYQRKVAVADFDGVCSGDIYILEPKNEYLLPGLLPFICQTDGFFEHAVGTSAGSLSPRTNWDSLASYEFALPPLEEQLRIAEVLEASRSAIEKLREARKSLSVTIESLIEENTNNDIVTKPMESKCLGELAHITKLAGFEYTKYVKYRPDGEIIAIRPLNIKNGQLILDDIQTIDKKTSDMLPRSKVKSGDVLITYIGEYVGEVLLIEESDKYHLAPNIARITSFGEIIPRLLEHLLRGASLQRQIASHITTTATPSLTMSALRKLTVSYPRNIKDQLDLIEKINVIEKASEKIRFRINQNQALFSSFVSYSLEGEVIP